MRNSKIISVAPMMDWTDSHCRYFMRLLNPNILLYSEMITTEALLYGNAKKYLHYNNEKNGTSSNNNTLFLLIDSWLFCS